MAAIKPIVPKATITAGPNSVPRIQYRTLFIIKFSVHGYNNTLLNDAEQTN